MEDRELDLFAQDQLPLLRQRVTVILLVGAVFIPLFIVADYLAYPDHLTRFLVYRAVCAIICSGLLVLHRLRDFGTNGFRLGVVGYYVCCLMVIKMIVDVGGYQTPYSYGLLLVVLGLCILLPVRLSQVAPHCALVYAIYLASVLIFCEPRATALFLVENLFLLGSIGLVLFAVRLSYDMRLAEYRTREALRKAQDKLLQYSSSLERSVVESEDKYRQLVDHANDAILIVQDDAVRFCNPRTEQLFGYSADEIEALRWSEMVAVEDREEVLSKLAGVRRPNEIVTLPFRVAHKQAELRWVDLNAVVIAWRQELALLCFLRDITERKRLEVELQQTMRMEAIGNLAGGVAHDFNNLLTVIMGNVQEVLTHVDPRSQQAAALKDVEEAAKRGAKLTGQLLAFSRREAAVEPYVVDLNVVVDGIRRMLKRLIGENIEVQTQIVDEPAPVKADAMQLEQIIINLAVNARDAMPSGGKLAILVANEGAGESEIVSLTVQDNGDGIDPQILRKVCEPFFTTKEAGKGTGLGLSIVYGIVKQHGGEIQISSDEHGTSIRMTFPRASVDELSGSVRALEVAPLGRERILLVEDEPLVRQATRRLLLKKGYEVLEAGNGDEALALLDEDANIDLLLTDVVMPGISGRELAERVQERLPSVKVIFTSGYTGDDVIQHGVATSAINFVQKPYDRDVLAAKIRTVLDEKN